MGCQLLPISCICTSGVFGKQTISFLKDLTCCVHKVSGEVQSFSYLLQCLAVAVHISYVHGTQFNASKL